MKVAVVTGSAGLVGSESVRFYARKGYRVAGIDNDMRSHFFGKEASTLWQARQLQQEFRDYEHHSSDIRSAEDIERVFSQYSSDIAIVVHTAAQPSHDWAASDPLMDFGINASGTILLLELTRKHCPKATFIFTSTNKVYGDSPNRLPLVEMETRWEVDPSHRYAANGIDESMSIDQCTHSVFGASKVAADVMVQEYGRYFGLNTGVFRGGCLTGPSHSGAALHGFLSYMMKCAVSGSEYRILGYKGKQVRDNIHSSDLIRAFDAFHEAPRPGGVYNMGGGRFSNCSLIEAIRLCEEIAGRKVQVCYVDSPRVGDHIWWISDVSRFKSQYPRWTPNYDIRATLTDIYQACLGRAHEERCRSDTCTGN